jgi:16S rRNA (cytosine967-C5)-methyltransferase
MTAPGGVLTYSVCTVTAAETTEIDTWLRADAGWEALPPPAQPWRPAGRGALLLPHAAGTDGMYVLQIRHP